MSGSSNTGRRDEKHTAEWSMIRIKICESVIRVGFDQVVSVDNEMSLRNEGRSGLGCRNERRNRNPQANMQKT
jgi:hypothetical protein